MAESVDALVSNTSGFIHPGSTPGLGTEKSLIDFYQAFFCFINREIRLFSNYEFTLAAIPVSTFNLLIIPIIIITQQSIYIFN